MGKRAASADKNGKTDLDWDDDVRRLVDIGGGVGPYVGRVRAKYPDLPEGSLILQDRREVVAKVEATPQIKTIEHDFFQPQPVKGTQSVLKLVNMSF